MGQKIPAREVETPIFINENGQKTGPNLEVDLKKLGSQNVKNLNYEGFNSGVTRSLQNKLEDYISVLDFGAKGDYNVTDNYQPFINALQKAKETGKGVYVPEGIYAFGQTLDFSDVFDNQVKFLHFKCHPNSEFRPLPSFVGTKLILIDTKTSGFFSSNFEFGLINGNNENITGLSVSSMNTSDISVKQIANCQNNGIEFLIPSDSVKTCFNNLIKINRISSNGNGLALQSNFSGSYGAVQGNIFKVGQIFNNTSNGVFVGLAGKDISDRNTFILGPVESNASMGIRDETGGNIYIVNNTNSNQIGLYVGDDADSIHYTGTNQDDNSGGTNVVCRNGGNLFYNGSQYGMFINPDGEQTIYYHSLAGDMALFRPEKIKMNNSSPTDIIKISGGNTGDRLLIKMDNNTTIIDSGDIRLNGSNFSGNLSSFIELVCLSDSVWAETSRASNP